MITSSSFRNSIVYLSRGVIITPPPPGSSSESIRYAIYRESILVASLSVISFATCQFFSSDGSSHISSDRARYGAYQDVGFTFTKGVVIPFPFSLYLPSFVNCPSNHTFSQNIVSSIMRYSSLVVKGFPSK